MYVYEVFINNIAVRLYAFLTMAKKITVTPAVVVVGDFFFMLAKQFSLKFCASPCILFRTYTSV